MSQPTRTLPPPSIIVTWLYEDVTNSHWVPLAIGLGLGYYWLGGLPNQGQDMMQIGQAYLLGGVGNYAYRYLA